jgi:HEAT repeat protein
VGELISGLLCGPDEDRYWGGVMALHWRGTREVMDRAVGLCRSSCAVERSLGADILGQLGVPVRTFPEPCLHALLGMLEDESDPHVLNSVLIALSHLSRPEAIVPASRFRCHEDPGVRYAAVHALTGHEDPRAIRSLIELTRDTDAHVRDWATFGLGAQLDLDTPEIREALAGRLADGDEGARSEAILGLARRRDPRVVPILQDELASDWVAAFAVEAAALIGSPSLHALLVELREWWDVDQNLLEEAIRACSPSSNPCVED